MRKYPSFFLRPDGFARRTFFQAVGAAGPAFFGASSGLAGSDSSFGKSLQEVAARTPVFDTHEHLVHENVRLSKKVDVFLLFSDYTNADLISAGMSGETFAKIQNPDIPLEERWSALAPYWQFTRSTGYGRWILIAARDLYGIDDISERTYHQLSERITASNRPGWYQHVLKEKAGTIICMVDDLATSQGQPLRPDPRFFRIVTRFDYIVMASNRHDLSQIEGVTNVAIHTLPDFENALEKAVQQSAHQGLAAIKCAIAYQRSLDIEPVTRAEASLAFDKVFASSTPTSPDPVAAKQLQDYMMHKLAEQAAEHRFVMQIHTGMHDGNRNHIAWTRPSYLSHFLMAFPQVKFDIFHGGYPYCGELATLGKNLPNVYANLCWLHLISPSVARRTLHEYIETVPANKILGFGGDALQVEGAYAASQMARSITADVLAEKVTSGYLKEEEAVPLLNCILYQNGQALFG